ncbi:retrovirus-related pol polyprotein from transposon TNT 1-94 [Tanacetum coccineum]
MTGNHSQLMNYVSKFLGIVRFRNDQISRIMGYGQFCDKDLELAFWKNTCFIRNLEGVDLLSGSRDTNLYIISLDDMLKTSLIYLLSKASKTKSWLCHHRLSHLNFDTLNKLAKEGLAQGIPRLIFQKDHLFLRTKDEAPEAIIKCIKNIQVRLSATVCNVRTYNGTEFVNQTLREFYENVGISHQTYVARTPQQNGVIESALCYPTNDNDDLGKLDAKADIVMASEQFSSGTGLHSMTPAISSSGLVSNPVSQQPFQEAAVVLADSPVATSIDQDALSTSIPSTQE